MRTRDRWRHWLSAHHHAEKEVWLLFHRKKTGGVGVTYDEAVEEALCFGWIDSIIKKIDETRYVRKFTPRRDRSAWSELNKKRADRMIREGRMTKVGMSCIDAAKRNGTWDRPVRPQVSLDLPSEFADALNKNARANRHFARLAPTYQKQYIIWINMARSAATRSRRIQESIALLGKGAKLGLR